MNIARSDLSISDSDLLMNKELLVPSYYHSLELRRSQNERVNNSPFDSFTDLDMIAYFVNQKTHIYEDKDRKVDTKREYMRDLLQFYHHLISSKEMLESDLEVYDKESLFKNLRARHIRTYQTWITTVPLGKGNKPYTAATLARKLGTIKTFLKWCYQNDFITHPLHDSFYRFHTRTTDIKNRYLYDEELTAILDFYKDDPINHCILAVLITTGMRVRELANADWKNLYYDMDRDEYYLKFMGKRDKLFEVRVFKTIYEELCEFRKRRGLSTELNRNSDEPLLVTKRCKRYGYKYLSKYVVNLVNKTALHFLANRTETISAHVLRHKFADIARRNGASIYEIQQRLQHASIKTTEIYLDSITNKEEDITLNWNENQFSINKGK